jgi:hypothetical protein
MKTVSHDRLTCHECHKPLPFNDVKRLASRENLDRYDSLMTRAALEKKKDFRWCLSASCKSGQIYDPVCDKFSAPTGKHDTASITKCLGIAVRLASTTIIMWV